MQSLKKFNWGRAVPLLIVISLVGGYLVYRSFAGTYTACRESNYTYSEQCLSDSDEASIIRLYYGVLGRAPDKEGTNYWVGRLNGTTGKKQTLAQIAAGFMNSGEFKNKYGTLSNQKFVEAMYPQVFGRKADEAGLKYWVDQLNTNKTTRDKLMIGFTQSAEMKSAFINQVAQALGVSPSALTTSVKAYQPQEVFCYGVKQQDNGKNVCSVEYQVYNESNSFAEQTRTVAAGVNLPELPSGEYQICYERKHEGVGSKPIAKDGLMPQPTNTVLANTVNSLVFNMNSGGGYYPVAASSTFSKECSDFSVGSKVTKSLVLTPVEFNAKTGQKGKTKIVLDSIRLNKYKNRQSIHASDQVGYYDSKNTGSKYVIKGSQITSSFSFHSFSADSTTMKPAWAGKVKAIKGTNNFGYIGYNSCYQNCPDASLQFNLKDSATKKPISATVTTTKPQGDQTAIRVQSSNQIKLAPQESISKVEFTVDKATDVEAELIIVSGSLSNQNPAVWFNFYL